METRQPLPIFSPLPPARFLHQLRELWRLAQLHQLEGRRPHFRGLLAAGGIHASVLRQWIRRLEPDYAAATMARHLACDAYRTTAWLHQHHKVAGEYRYSPSCPNCDIEEPEDMAHLIWKCPRWAELRPQPLTTVADMPEVVQRTLLPVCTLSKAQLLRLHAAFQQAAHILAAHTRHGRPPRPYPRRRVIGKQNIQQVQQRGHVPEAPGRDPHLGGHNLHEVLHEGFLSMQCHTCGMRARIRNLKWFVTCPCGPRIHRRSDLIKCPMGLADLSSGGAVDEFYAVCLWCGAFDRQRTNLFRRHKCWDTLFGNAIRERHNTAEDHILYLVGRAGGEHVGHDLHWLEPQQRYVCIACGRVSMRSRAKGACRGLRLAEWRYTPEEYAQALNASAELFFPLA